MSRKDYELIARTFKSLVQEYGETPNFNESAVIMAHTIAVRLAMEFKADNPRFNPDKFMQACGF